MLVKSFTALSLLLFSVTLYAETELPIADAHVHYSHDSVELTPPERVVELMREANLQFALVSSSDDNGTQLLSDLAPDLIVPGLRPYRRRGELGTWFTDPGALAYVERLLATNKYATIGEFHLYGTDVELPIPRRIVELADQYNLILHAHSDADAVDRLLMQSETVKVLWAHSGFDDPKEIAAMLEKHDRLWADLAFRSEVGSGGSLSEDWKMLFQRFPDRMMLGTDTYTPERMYYIPEHADSARVWLNSLQPELAERVAWKNAHDLIMPVWNRNRDSAAGDNAVDLVCTNASGGNEVELSFDGLKAYLRPLTNITVSQPFAVEIALCGEGADNIELSLDALMPTHGHGMNYKPEQNVTTKSEREAVHKLEGLVLHMPGRWQWRLALKTPQDTVTLTHDFEVQ